MHNIDVVGPMALAFQGVGESSYTPVLQGVSLEPENGQTDATLRNLNAILDSGDREIIAFLLGHSRVLVVFLNGNTYLATGFGYGSRDVSVREFAYFAAKHGFGAGDDLFDYLAGLRNSAVMTKPGLDDDEFDDDMDEFNRMDGSSKFDCQGISGISRADQIS